MENIHLKAVAVRWQLKRLVNHKSYALFNFYKIDRDCRLLKTEKWSPFPYIRKNFEVPLIIFGFCILCNLFLYNIGVKPDGARLRKNTSLKIEYAGLAYSTFNGVYNESKYRLFPRAFRVFKT